MSLYPESKELKIPIKENTHTPQPPGAEGLIGDTGESHSLGIFQRTVPSDYFLIGRMLLRGRAVIFKDPTELHL